MRTLVHLATAALLVAPSSAQSVIPLVREGDVIPGVGSVTDVNHVTMLTHLFWIVEVDTDNPDPDLATVAISNGYVLLREGDALAAPPGATIKAFDSWSIGSDSALASNYALGGSVPSSEAEGVYYNGGLVAQRGKPAAASGFSPGTTWGSFGNVQVGPVQAGVAGRLLVRGFADDPAVAGTADFFAAIVDVDWSGALLSARVIAKEGDVPPGQADTINTIRTGSWSGRIGPKSEVFWACDLNGSDASDACVYRWNPASGVSTLVAQEGTPSPVAGRSWGDLVSPEIDVNAAGDWTLKDRLDGSAATDGIIVRNGVKLVQEGDSHPDIAPFVLNELGNGPAKLTDSGQVLWFGGWDDTAPGAYREALFLDQTILVREGQTTVEGILLQDIEQQNDSYTISGDGGFVIFIGTLADGREGAFLYTASGITSYCTAKTASVGCRPVITWNGTPSASAGSGFQVYAHAVVNNVIGLFFYGTSGATAKPFSGGTLCVQSPVRRLAAQGSGGSPFGSDCSGSFLVDFNAYAALGLDPLLVPGAQVNGQYWYRDPGLGPPFPTGLSYAIQFPLGP